MKANNMTTPKHLLEAAKQMGRLQIITVNSAVKPPDRTYNNARPWSTFQSLFSPIKQPNGSFLVEPEHVPKDADHRHWWTIVDLNPAGRTFYLLAGFHRANRLGLIRCQRAWDGEPDEHPEYTYL